MNPILECLDLDPTARVVITGVPRAGKTTLALDLEHGDTRHTDDLIDQMKWSEVSEHVARDWFAKDGPWIVEGTAAVRALRKYLKLEEGRPCDVALFLSEPFVDLTDGQDRMAKACHTIWNEAAPELTNRGVELIGIKRGEVAWRSIAGEHQEESLS